MCRRGRELKQKKKAKKSNKSQKEDQGLPPSRKTARLLFSPFLLMHLLGIIFDKYEKFVVGCV